MVLKLEDIASLLRLEGSSSDDVNDATPESELARRNRRTSLLAPVLETCIDELNKGYKHFEALAKVLGDGVRDEAWRRPFGASGILIFFLKEVLNQTSPSDALMIQTLRIIGNSCADTDENRQTVLDGGYLNDVMGFLQYPHLVPYVIPVLYNILLDYAPAQAMASELLLNTVLISLLSSENVGDFAPLIPYFCKILSLLADQRDEATFASPLTVHVLLALAVSPLAKPTLETFMPLVSSALSYLANETLQTNLINGRQMDVFMLALLNAHTGFDPDRLDDADEATQLRQLRTSLFTTLADLSGNDAFVDFYPLAHSVPQLLLAWLQGADPRLQAAACIALGNLSRSDEISLELVQKYQAHRPLVNTLSNQSTTDSQQLHSVLSFLKNLAIPPQNKLLLGELLEATRLPRILTMDTLPQVQFAAVSLTRLLLVNCPSNAHRICAPRTAGSAEHTGVHDILALFARSDTEPTKLEAARSILALCRVLHMTPVFPVLPEWDALQETYVSANEPLQPSSEGGDEKESRMRGLFYKKHDLAKPLSLLVTQQKWPIVRSEAWFVLALMSRSRDGTAVIASVLNVPDVVNALSRAVTGNAVVPDSEEQMKQIEAATAALDNTTEMAEGLGLEPQQVDPKQQASMTRVDRENCMVLCTEVVKKSSGILTVSQLGLLQNLLRQGRNLIAQEKETLPAV